MRGLHLGTRPTSTTPGTGASGRVTFIVVDDVVYLTDPVTGYVYEAPVTFVGPTTLPSGLITADADTLFFHYAGGTWSSPATQVEGAAPVGGTILNDTFYVTIASVTYALPVTATGDIPGMPPGGETSLVVIDGVEYLRIVFPDGEVRYEQVNEEPTPDAEGGGGGTANLLNIRDFGAVGDGITNDTLAIQTALDTGPCFAPPGTYAITTLELPSDATLAGAGLSTVLRSSVSGNTAIIRNKSSFAGVTTRVRISDLTIAGTDGSGGTGLWLNTFTNSAFTNLRIINCRNAANTGRGLYMENEFGDCYNNTFAGLTIENCDDALTLTSINAGNSCGYNFFSALTIAQEINGIKLLLGADHGGTYNTFTGIFFQGNAGPGIYLDISGYGNRLTGINVDAPGAGPILRLQSTAQGNFVGIASGWDESKYQNLSSFSNTVDCVQQLVYAPTKGFVVNDPCGDLKTYFHSSFSTSAEVELNLGNASGDQWRWVMSGADGLNLRLLVPGVDYPISFVKTAGAPVEFKRSVLVPDDPYNASSWDGNLSVPTKNAVRDALAALGSGGGVAVSDSPTWTGKHIFGVAGAASAPAVSLTGPPYVGGTATTTKPLLLIEPTGTTSTNWSTLGTMLGVNAPAGFAGNLLDAQLNGVSKFKVANDGSLTLSDHIVMTAGRSLYSTSVTSFGALTLTHANGDDVRIQNGSSTIPVVGFYSTGAVALTYLRALSAANLALGGAPKASPVAQTLTVGEASRPGTDSDVAGANGTIQSGLGTGTGTASSLIFQTPTVAGAGSGVQTYGTRLTINANGLNFPTAIATGWIQGTTIYVGVTGTTALKSTVDGILGLYNSAENNFSRLQLGGTTASFPAIKRSGTGLAVRLADDSADSSLTVADEAYGGSWDGSLQVPTKNALYDKIQTLGGGGGVALGDSPTWTGAHIFSRAGAVSSPTLSLTGSLFSGGTAFTTKPLMLLEATGTPAGDGWRTQGTMLGINVPSAFQGAAFEVQEAGISKFQIDSWNDAVQSAYAYSYTGPAGGVAYRINSSSGTFIFFNGRARIVGGSIDGVLGLSDDGGTSFNRLWFGGSTASYPAIKRNATALNFRLADDSADCAISALSLTTGAPAGGTAGTWKFGIRVAASTTHDTTQYIQVDIGGTLYKLALAV